MAFPSILLKQLASSWCGTEASAAMRLANRKMSVAFNPKRKCQVATSADVVVQPIEVTSSPVVVALSPIAATHAKLHTGKRNLGTVSVVLRLKIESHPRFNLKKPNMKQIRPK
jgi:hypothetical protein